jgi:hypothetical protein
MSTDIPVKVSLDWFQLTNFSEHGTVNGILALSHAKENVRTRGEVPKEPLSKTDALQIHLTCMNVLKSYDKRKVCLLFVVDAFFI